MAGLSQAITTLINTQSNNIIKSENYSIDLVNKFMFTTDEDGKYHSYDDNPAIIYMDTNINIWMNHGVIHRDDFKPAVICEKIKMFYNNGLLHNKLVNNCISNISNSFYWNGMLYLNDCYKTNKIREEYFTRLLFLKLENRCYSWDEKNSLTQFSINGGRRNGIFNFSKADCKWVIKNIEEFKTDDNTYEFTGDSYMEKQYENKTNESNIVNNIIKNINNIFEEYPELEKICEINGKTKTDVINHWKFIITKIYYIYVELNILEQVYYDTLKKKDNYHFIINKVSKHYSNCQDLYQFIKTTIEEKIQKIFDTHITYSYLCKYENINFINKYNYYIYNECNQHIFYKCTSCEELIKTNYISKDNKKVYCEKCNDFIDIE
jgi:hypothetical protein